ncbi:GTPase IMAP family member 8-like [Clarias gariepinus]|uniref:GTPase IMAP family member 8-like n=1 Tax=Clarias gariepinus TaxID=13013 RepID=UPI00234CC269|nr:GTPase IMAP family member 8-like [Clarias gariepinus]
MDSFDLSYDSGEIHLSEVRIVLLGSMNAGKSSAGNTILGRKEFDLKRTAQCVMRQGDVAGRKITVVEAPGWRRNKSIRNSTEELKQEIILSVSRCSPGPHAVLLVLRLDLKSWNSEQNVLEGYLELLTERVWSHTIVLFTFGDALGDTTIEQYIKTEEYLQGLVKKCGNRYHVFTSKKRDDVSQVTELLEKIEKMVAGNGGCHLEMDKRIKEERKTEDGKKSKEQVMVSRRRKDIISHKREIHLSEVRIVLLGSMNAGKSSSVNSILGGGKFDLKRTAQCVMRQGDVAGRKITVVEAPGWQRNKSIRNSTEEFKQEIILSVSRCPPGPHAVLLVLRLDVKSWKSEQNVLEGYLELLTERVWIHTIVLFTFGDALVDMTIEQYTKKEKYLQCLVEKCGNRYHVFTNKKRHDDSQVTELLEKIEKMVAENGGCHLKMDKKIIKDMEKRRKQVENRSNETVTEIKRREGLRLDARAEFVDKHRAALIQRFNSVMEVADCLKGKKMITNEMYSKIRAMSTHQEKMRELYECLDSTGRVAKQELYNILKKNHNGLFKDLESDSEVDSTQ